MATQKTPLSGAERMAQAEAALDELKGQMNALILSHTALRTRCAALDACVQGLAQALAQNSAYDRWEAAERVMKQYEAADILRTVETH